MRKLTQRQVAWALQQVLREMGLVRYDSEELKGRPERPQSELELELKLRILDFLNELLKIVEKLFKSMEGLVGREIVEQLRQLITKLREFIWTLRIDLMEKKIRQFLKKTLGSKTSNGAVPREEPIKIRWKELINGLSNTEVDGGFPRTGKPERWFLIKINGYSFLISLEELGPGRSSGPDSNGD